MPSKRAQWFITYPQCGDLSREDVLAHLKTIDDVIHYVIALEKHQDGNNHIHGYVKFVDGLTVNKATTALDCKGYHGNYQPCRSPKHVIQYCTKEENYSSNFDIKQYLSKKGKVDATTLREKTTKDALIDGDISFMSARAYQYARSIVQVPYRPAGLRGIWIYGPAGVGKSRLVLDNVSPVFEKTQNKWFDGYNQEKDILIDDVDKQGTGLSHYLKRWADRYPCSGEVKGGNTQLHHDRLWVTSNYHPKDLWDDEELVKAITRRFKMVYIPDPSQVPAFDTLKRDVDQFLTGISRSRSRSP